MLSKDDLRELLLEYAQTYQFMSQVFFRELSIETIEELALAQYPKHTGNDNLDQGYRLIRRYFAFRSTDARTELACEYARIFLAAGVYTETRDIAVPYESVFTSEDHLIMQESRDDVFHRYVEDGFKVNPDTKEPEDHLAFELEYLALLNERAVALSDGADDQELLHNVLRQREFMEHHLLNWLPKLTETAQKYAQLTFYIGMLFVVQGYLETEKALFDELVEEGLPSVPAKCCLQPA